jgi:protease-4
LDKIGLTPIVIKSGEYKDTGSPIREMSLIEKRMLESFVKRIHKQFIEDVSSGRKLEKDRVESIADGRILTGEEAKGLGLVDRLGNFHDAVQWAGELGGIKGEITSIFTKEKKPSWLKYLLESSIRTILDRAADPTLHGGYLYHPAQTESP